MLKLTAPYPPSFYSTLPRNFDHSFSNLRKTLKNNWASNESSEQVESYQKSPLISKDPKNNEMTQKPFSKTINLFAEVPKLLISSEEIPGYRGNYREEMRTIKNNWASNECPENLESSQITPVIPKHKNTKNNNNVQKALVAKTINLYAENPKLLIAPSEIPGYQLNSREEAKRQVFERRESASVKLQYFYRKHRKDLKKKIGLLLNNGNMVIFEDFEKFEEKQEGKNNDSPFTLNRGKNKECLNQLKLTENNKIKMNLFDSRNVEIKKDGLSIIDIFARKNMGKFPIANLLNMSENKPINKKESIVKNLKVENHIKEKSPANTKTQSDYYSDDFEEIESSIESSNKNKSNSSNKSVSEIVEDFKSERLNTESIKEELENLSEKSSVGVISEESALQNKSKQSDKISEKISIKDDNSEQNLSYNSEIREIPKKETRVFVEKKVEPSNLQKKDSHPKKIELNLKKISPAKSDQSELKYEQQIEMKGTNKLNSLRETIPNANIENINWKNEPYLSAQHTEILSLTKELQTIYRSLTEIHHSNPPNYKPISSNSSVLYSKFKTELSRLHEAFEMNEKLKQTETQIISVISKKKIVNDLKSFDASKIEKNLHEEHINLKSANDANIIKISNNEEDLILEKIFDLEGRVKTIQDILIKNQYNHPIDYTYDLNEIKETQRKLLKLYEEAKVDRDLLYAKIEKMPLNIQNSNLIFDNPQSFISPVRDKTISSNRFDANNDSKSSSKSNFKKKYEESLGLKSDEKNSNEKTPLSDNHNKIDKTIKSASSIEDEIKNQIEEEEDHYSDDFEQLSISQHKNPNFDMEKSKSDFMESPLTESLSKSLTSSRENMKDIFQKSIFDSFQSPPKKKIEIPEKILMTIKEFDEISDYITQFIFNNEYKAADISNRSSPNKRVNLDQFDIKSPTKMTKSKSPEAIRLSFEHSIRNEEVINENENMLRSLERQMKKKQAVKLITSIIKNDNSPYSNESIEDQAKEDQNKDDPFANAYAEFMRKEISADYRKNTQIFMNVENSVNSVQNNFGSICHKARINLSRFLEKQVQTQMKEYEEIDMQDFEKGLQILEKTKFIDEMEMLDMIQVRRKDEENVWKDMERWVMEECVNDVVEEMRRLMI